MDVSENSGTPKSSILIGFSIINHPFWRFSHYFRKHPNGVFQRDVRVDEIAMFKHAKGHRLQWSILGSVKNTRTEKNGRLQWQWKCLKRCGITPFEKERNNSLRFFFWKCEGVGNILEELIFVWVFWYSNY